MQHRQLEEVSPIVFGQYGEASDGMKSLISISALTEAWVPEIAEHYLLDDENAAEPIAKGADPRGIQPPFFNAQARIPLSPKYCQPGWCKASAGGRPKIATTTRGVRTVPPSCRLFVHVRGLLSLKPGR
jgi:hypothetical protein